MRRTNICGTFLLILAACLALAGGPARAADRVPAARRLPPNVNGYVTIPSVSKLKERWAESLLGQLCNDKSLEDFFSDVRERLGEVSRGTEEHLGLKIGDLLNIPAGEISMAVVHSPEKNLAFVALLDFGENRDTVDKLLEKGEEALAEQEAERSEKEFEDTKIIEYTLSTKETDDEKKSPGEKFAYFLKDTQIVIGSNAEVLETVLARWDGEHSKTFAHDEEYRYITDHLKSGDSAPLFLWYVNPIRLVHAAVSAAGQENLQAQMALAYLPMLGLTSLKAVAGSVDMVVGGFDTVSRTLLYVDQPTAGILNVFHFPAVDQAPPKWVNSKATAYFSINWDVTGAWSAIRSLVDTIPVPNPGAFDQLIEQIAANPDGPMVHPKKDIVDQLNGRIHVITGASETEDAVNERFLVAFGVKDAVKMKSLLAKLTKEPTFPGTSREFRGETLYEIPVNATSEDGPESIGLGLVNGHVMIAFDVKMLEEIIRADKGQVTLADSAGYKRIAERFPEKTSMLGYQRQESQVQVGYELLRSSNVGLFLGGVDFSKLPPFDAIRKYLSESGSYVVPDKRGVLTVSFTLHSEKK